MSSSPSHSRNPQTPPTHSRVTFQSTPNSGTTRSSNDGHPSPSVELSKEEVFENNLTQLFTKGFLAVQTSKDAILKEVRDCILQDDPQRCKEVNPYLFSYWRDLHVRSGCICVDERVAIPHAIQDAVLESLHLTHPGSWGMITLGQYAFWPYMHREILNKAATCKPCTDIGKNLKSVIPASKWKPLLPCTEPNEEIQIDFGGPITNEKDQDTYFLACIDRFSKYPSVEVFDKANGPNVLKFLDDYIQIHGVPRNIRLDKARCLIGYKVKNFCKQHNINILPAPVNDHRAIGLVERLIQTIKRRLGCMKLDNRNKTFTIKEAIKSIVYQLRICKQKTTNVTPFQAHFGRKPNQKAKVTNKYDEEFAVATITRIRDAIAAIYVNTTPQSCQSQHFNSVINTHSTRASHPRSTNYSNLLSAINRNTNQLLLKYSAHAAQLQTHSNTSTNPTQIQSQLNTKSNHTQIHVIENHKMSSSPSHSRNPQTPPTHSRVTFQSTPNSGTTRSSNDGHPSPSVELSKEEVFENNLKQLFTKGFLALQTSKDAVLKEVRDCILQDDPQRCKEGNPYLFSYWRDLHVRSGCVCVDERVAIPHAIQDAVLESLHLTHPGSWGMITLGQYAFWPYMHSEILNKAATCKPCTDIGKNLKSVIPASKWKPLLPCTEPNEEIQIDFGGPITNEKDQDTYFLACIDRFSKYPSVEVFDKANGPNVLKFLDDYIQIHGVPRNIRLDQARCLIGYKVKNFCKQHNINILPAPVNDHRAIGLVERLIQTIKRRLGCMKLDNRNKTFTIKEAIKSIVYQLRICKQKTTNVTPFQAHFGRKPNTPLSNISTTPKSSNLSYENILHHYLDADTVPVEDYLDDNGWVTGDRSDILIEEAMQRAQVAAGRRYNGEHNKSVPRFILHPKLNNPIPISEQSLDLKLARKVNKRSKTDLRGLGKHWRQEVRLFVHRIRQPSSKNQEYPKLVFAIAILLNSVLAPNGTPNYGNTRNVDPYHTTKQRKKKLHSTRRI